jgi:hypothetical protein
MKIPISTDEAIRIANDENETFARRIRCAILGQEYPSDPAGIEHDEGTMHRLIHIAVKGK